VAGVTLFAPVAAGIAPIAAGIAPIAPIAADIAPTPTSRPTPAAPCW
jgi:hypothetical protein